MKKHSIGWVAIHREYDHVAGHNTTFGKIYGTQSKAFSSQRKNVQEPVGTWPHGGPKYTWRRETDEEVSSKWMILEVFVEIPDEAS